MKYKHIVKGKFINRPNRFIAKVSVDGIEETVHVKNTGRCRELLVPDCTVVLSVSDNPARKTKYDLIAVYKEIADRSPLLINMDSQVPNDVAEEWLKDGNLFSEDAKIYREKTYGKSRFDFYIEDGDTKAFLEVKGVTLENDGVVRFPDAPTERGVKHINELASCIDDGFKAYILFVVQMNEADYVSPNYATHQEFGDALKSANEKGVEILSIKCHVTDNSITYSDTLKFKF